MAFHKLWNDYLREGVSRNLREMSRLRKGNMVAVRSVEVNRKSRSGCPHVSESNKMTLKIKIQIIMSLFFFAPLISLTYYQIL